MAYGNGSTINVKITRLELIDLMIACNSLDFEVGGKKWNALHDKLSAILEVEDAKHDYGVFKQ